MKCPYNKDIDCIHLDTSGMTQTTECNDCSIKKLYSNYELPQMLNFLPQTIIKEKKQLFRYKDIYDLRIEKDHLNNWHICYINNMNQKTLFEAVSGDLKTAGAIILSSLLIQKYITL